MGNEQVSCIFDKRSKCYSIVCDVTLDWYLDLVETPYESGGNIEGQREALSTKAGRRIRSQMVDDFKAGGVLPAVVVGLETSGIKFVEGNTPKIFDLLANFPSEDISILDGMQRTTAMKEAMESTEEADFKNRIIRVEFWVAEKIHALLYRMLVLNTGQVPWSLRRQIEVVFSSLKKDLVDRVENLQLLEVDTSERRTAAGLFHANKLIEIFLIIGTRSERLDVKEKLADDFLRLDFIENASDKELTEYYFSIVQVIVNLDLALGRENVNLAEGRFKKGIDLFSSQPALSGFSVAISQHIFGRPGKVTDATKQQERKEKLVSGFTALIQKMNEMSQQELKDFCAFDVLNEETSPFKQSGKIGDEERRYFKQAFKVIMEENFDIDSLEVCWRV